MRISIVLTIIDFFGGKAKKFLLWPLKPWFFLYLRYKRYGVSDCESAKSCATVFPVPFSRSAQALASTAF